MIWSPGPSLQRHLVHDDYGYMHLRTSGQGVGTEPGLLLLHQIPNSSRSWLRVMAELPKLDCVAPDMFNLGESDQISRQLSLQEHAESLWRSSMSVLAGRKIIVGHHSGAALAAVLAATHPEDIDGVILIGYPVYSDWRSKLSRYERLNPLRVDRDGASVQAAWKFNLGAFSDGADEDLILQSFADRIRAGSVWYEGYVALWNADLHQILADASKTPMPKLVIAPTHDPLTPHASSVAQVLGANTVEIDGGSFVLGEDPAAVAKAICDFCASL